MKSPGGRFYTLRRMRSGKKTAGTLVGLLLLGFVVGSLLWEVIERIMSAAGVSLDLSVGPVGFDVHALAVSLRPNPGSLAGVIAAALLYRAL